MRCEQCEKIPLVEIHTPQEYMLCIGSLARMLLAGEVEMTYQTCPLDKIMDNDNKWYAEKLFHQFRCTKCGTIYGMLCNTLLIIPIKRKINNACNKTRDL